MLMSFRAFLHLLKDSSNVSCQSIPSADDLPATVASNGASIMVYFGMHSVSCLMDPIQLRICFTVVGGIALISGEIVCDVGDHPSLLFLHPNNTAVSGTMTSLLGLNVNPHSAALVRTSMNVCDSCSSVSAITYNPSAIRVI